jgi:translin
VNAKLAGKKLTEIQKEREKLLPLSRGIVIDCSKAIRVAHVYDEKASKAMRDKIRKDVKALQAAVKGSGLKSLLTTAEQEWVELEVLMAFTNGEELPEVDCSPETYLLGVMDGIGECKRAVLDMLAQHKIKEADEALHWLEGAYYEIHGMAFPSSLVPGLKAKQDSVKRSLDSLHAAVREAQSRSRE